MSDQIRTVIAGFDGTEGAAAGLRFGATIATRMHARFLVATAIDFEPLVSVPATESARSLAEYEAAKQNHLGQIFQRACEVVGSTPFERRGLEGSAARSLIECAEAETADLFALGATHHGPVGRVFPGSVGQKVLQGSPCPVAVAPNGWARDSLENIAVGFDGREESFAALRFAAAIAAASRAQLEVLSVLPTHMIVEGRLVDDVEMRERCRDRLDRAVADLPGHGASGVLLEHEDGVSERLAAECSRRDLLVVGSRGYGAIGRVFLGSVSARLLASPKCPVIAVPRPGRVPERVLAEEESVAAT